MHFQDGILIQMLRPFELAAAAAPAAAVPAVVPAAHYELPLLLVLQNTIACNNCWDNDSLRCGLQQILW
jgi:hypothetical protein